MCPLYKNWIFIRKWMQVSRYSLIAAGVMLPMTMACMAQPGGKAYQFLEVTNSARVAAVGGTVIVLDENDLNLPYHNPATLNENMHHHAVVNYVNYFAGIHYGYAAFAARAGSMGTFAAGIHYLNYGSFQGADENGLLTGTFRAADYSVNLSYARPLDSLFSIGITLKSIYSDLEAYKSTALAMDFGITYRNPDRNFAAGLVIRNAGWQVSKYYPFGDREPLPLNISLGISQELQHAPIRFTLVAEHLEKWDLTYDSEINSENTTYAFMDEQAGKGKFDRFFDKLMRHMVFGAEVYPTRNLTLRAGYNYRRRQELKIESKPATVGFSLGVGVHVSRFQIDYGRSTFHLAGAVNYFSVSFNIDELNRKF